MINKLLCRLQWYVSFIGGFYIGYDELMFGIILLIISAIFTLIRSMKKDSYEID